MNSINILKSTDKHICSICLDDINLVSNGKHIWMCSHIYFHNECIEDWKRINNSCPICRCDKIYIIPKITITDYDKKLDFYNNIEYNKKHTKIINNYKFKFYNDNQTNYKLTLSKYSESWNYECCNTQYDNHIISISKPFNVFGFCSCGNTKSYNWEG